MSGNDRLMVAACINIDRKDKCAICGTLMFYRLDENETVIESFCGSIKCLNFLKDIPE